MKFGLYLHEWGVLNAKQLVEALRHQLNSRPQIGSLAIRAGKLSMHQVFQVLGKQCSEQDKLFGELAVGEGFMSEEDLAELLNLQTNETMHMEKVLVELGFLSAEDAHEQLACFREEMQQGTECQGSMTTASP